MSAAEIFPALTDLFRDIFDEDDLELTPATTAAEVEGWDSLSHIRMILAVEQRFGVRFSASQVSTLPNVGALVDLIATKRAAS